HVAHGSELNAACFLRCAKEIVHSAPGPDHPDAQGVVRAQNARSGECGESGCDDKTAASWIVHAAYLSHSPPRRKVAGGSSSGPGRFKLRTSCSVAAFPPLQWPCGIHQPQGQRATAARLFSYTARSA